MTPHHHRFTITAAVLLFGLPALAQHGTATGYFFPSNYHGDTFTGRVVQASEEKGELTLEYSSKKKTESFTGVIEGPCKAQKKDAPRDEPKQLHLSAIPKDSVITVFYNNERVKQTDSPKVEVHRILGIRFDEVNGNKFTNPNRPIIFCSTPGAGVTVF